MISLIYYIWLNIFIIIIMYTKANLSWRLKVEYGKKYEIILFTGFYRVNYDDSNWQKLALYLKSPFYLNISAINRAQLIDDAANLARTGHLAYEIALEIISYLSRETDYIPWYAAVRVFNDLDTVLIDGKSYTEYRVS